MKYYAYIDESGDEGFKWYADGTGASKWLVLAAMIVRKENFRPVLDTVDEIRARLAMATNKVLHWKDKKDHAVRKYICQRMSDAPVTLSYVAVNKQRLTATQKLKKPPALYFYATRYLVERISWFAAENGGRVDLIFENRASLSYDDLNDYINHLKKDPCVQIRDVIDKVTSLSKGQSKTLELCDCAAGALFEALELDRFGNREPAYIMELRSRLYRRKGNLFAYGLKLFPENGSILAKRPGWEWLQEI